MDRAPATAASLATEEAQPAQSRLPASQPSWRRKPLTRPAVLRVPAQRRELMPRPADPRIPAGELAGHGKPAGQQAGQAEPHHEPAGQPAGHHEPAGQPAGHHEPAGQQAGHGEPAGQPGSGSPRRRVSGGLVTPWLAAGAGLVVLAAMALSAPTAVLTFPSSPGVRCHGSACKLPDGTHQARGNRAGALAGPGKHLRQAPSQGRRAAADPSDPTSAPPIPVTIRYQVLSRWSGHFDAQVLIIGQRKLGPWTLAVSVPGAKIQFILGASWHPNAAGDGGVAAGTPWPWARSSADSARIILFGTGVPSGPVGCSFNGNSCTFQVSP